MNHNRVTQLSSGRRRGTELLLFVTYLYKLFFYRHLAKKRFQFKY
jgi:hypothetical protein